MPNIDYTQIIKKHNLGDFDLKFYEKSKNEIIENIEAELIKAEATEQIPLADLQKVKEIGNVALENVIEKSKLIFDALKDKEIDVDIIPTKFGSYGSYYFPVMHENRVKIELRPRLDKNLFDDDFKNLLIELYISAITFFWLRDDKHYDWQKREAVSDFFTKYVFNLSDYKGTLSVISELNADLLLKSQQFLVNSKLPIGKNLSFDAINSKIFLRGFDITEKLSTYEIRLLSLFIENYGKVVDYDLIAERLYNTLFDAKFSFWGIAKTVQRLRNKLSQHGLSRDFIQNVKGEGFRIRG